MTYKIIHDEEAVRNFIDFYLPTLKENERFYWCLFARKKYSPDLIKSNDRTQLKRGLATKENLLNKLYQLELPLGRWVLKDVPAPQESLVVYINPNPRHMIKGAWKGVKKLLKILENHSNGHNPIAEITSAIQQAKSYNYVVDFDVDSNATWTKDKLKRIIRNHMKMILPSRCYDVLETRNGFHILVNAKAAKNGWMEGGKYITPVEYPRNWYKAIQEAIPADLLDQTGDQLIPIPGTTQGGFVPKFIEA